MSSLTCTPTVGFPASALHRSQEMVPLMVSSRTSDLDRRKGIGLVVATSGHGASGLDSGETEPGQWLPHLRRATCAPLSSRFPEPEANVSNMSGGRGLLNAHGRHADGGFTAARYISLQCLERDVGLRRKLLTDSSGWSVEGVAWQSKCFK